MTTLQLFPTPVLAATRWPSNAEMVADLARVGHLRTTDRIIDPTYGRGTWWKLWRPEELRGSDIDPAKSPTMTSIDFTALPYDDDSFDAAAFDPPYIAEQGHKSTSAEFGDRYGIAGDARRPEHTQARIDAGLTELARVVRRYGRIVVKAMDYTNGRTFFPGAYYTTAHALSIGLRMVDRLEHLRQPGPTPNDGTTQHTARRNYSTVLVFAVR